MKTYIDHFEIESKRPGETWKHIGYIYPEYKWEIQRPWYFLWLVKRPVITNGVDALAITFTSLVRFITTASMLNKSPESKERVRLIIWTRRRFLGLVRAKVVEQ